MVGSDIGDINSPPHAGSRSTRVDPKLFGKPLDFSGDRREWRHFEWVFRNWFGFLYDTAEEWLDQAANSPVELGEAVPDRRETDKALYRSLAMVCKNEALDLVKTVTHKRGFESWLKLSKEYGATTGTSLHEYTNLLEYGFGTTDGFKKRLLKSENQIVDFQKATGEVFSDRLKCAIVLSRSPAPIRTYLRVQNRGDYGALRVALMNYLEADGAMKGKKGDRGKKGYDKGKFDKNLGKYDKSNEHSKRNDYSKGSEKGRERGKKGKGKGQGKDEKPAANSSFQHMASECWQGYVQAVEEVPSSSANSVAPSAATTPAAAKIAALIQEFNVEQGPGWIFGVMGGSVASVTTGTDNLWDELVLDSGSVSTACPYAWCSDISVNNEDKVHLQDIQQRRIPSHGSRVVPLELWGPEGCVECKVKFDVADVAYPVVSLGKMIESGFTFSFDDYTCYMHKGNRRVEIFRKGRIFVLRMRRRWLESKVQMVAPIEEVAAGEMEIDDDEEGAEDARIEPR